MINEEFQNQDYTFVEKIKKLKELIPEIPRLERTSAMEDWSKEDYDDTLSKLRKKTYKNNERKFSDFICLEEIGLGPKCRNKI